MRNISTSTLRLHAWLLAVDILAAAESAAHAAWLWAVGRAVEAVDYSAEAAAMEEWASGGRDE